ncbi:MAG: response regulator [Sphingomonas sp.]|jgi:DNA-binding response OmpR family regulator|nr:response regulator [Sphingomonas sp.]
MPQRENICDQPLVGALSSHGKEGQARADRMIFRKRKRSIVRLLLVEDEPLVAFDTEHLLTEQDYEIVATVDRVADAVATLSAGHDVHLVLVDVNLADGSGIDVARVAGERGIPSLFVTGHCPPEAELFGVGCLYKPFDQRDLLLSIEAIELSRAGKAMRRLPEGLRLFAAEKAGGSPDAKERRSQRAAVDQQRPS